LETKKQIHEVDCGFLWLYWINTKDARSESLNIYAYFHCSTLLDWDVVNPKLHTTASRACSCEAFENKKTNTPRVLWFSMIASDNKKGCTQWILKHLCTLSLFYSAGLRRSESQTTYNSVKSFLV